MYRRSTYRQDSSKSPAKKTSNWIYLFRRGEEIPENLCLTHMSKRRFYIWGISQRDIFDKMRIDFKKIGYNALVDFTSERRHGNLLYYGYLAKVEPKHEHLTDTVVEDIEADSLYHFDWTTNQYKAHRDFKRKVQIFMLLFVIFMFWNS